MSVGTAIGLLRQHSIRYRIYKGVLQAESIYCSDRVIARGGKNRWTRRWDTVQGWTTDQLLEWLGY